MRELPDAELVTRVLRRDDRDAFSELVRRHQGLVRTLLRKLTGGDRSLADDLAQETFVKAYLKLATFRAQASLSSWMYRIAYNAFLAHLRQAGRRAQREQAGAADQDAVSALRPRPAERSALALDLERAMLALSEVERASIALCYALDMSHAEAAVVLDIPVGTLKTHILRGKDKLRPQLGAWSEESSDEVRS